MRAITAGAVILAAASGAAADLCAKGSEEILGNWYCQAVKKITYQNLVAASGGQYNKVTSMDSSSGSCSSEPHHFSGKMAPLDEDLSFHVRGPAHLKQFAVYYPAPADSKMARRSPRGDALKHGHQYFHERMAERRAEEKREPEMVTAVINGQQVTWEQGAPTPAAAAVKAADQPEYIVATMNGEVVSWPNPEYQGAATAPTPPPQPQHQQQSQQGGGHQPEVQHDTPVHKPVSTPHKPSKPEHHDSSAPIIPGDWVRAAYYDAASGTADKLTFLNNKGGGESGVFDYSFGNSLGYAASDGVNCAASSQVLSDTMLPSNEEVIVMSDRPCKNGDCGFVRDGTVAYHGFPGKHKAFLMEFSMPDDGMSGWNENMPAIWLLNGQIPRTLQYGNADCSCWTSGCGEVDLFEVLDAGNHRMKSTLHGFYQGGDSDWFERPTEGTMKAAVVFSDEEIHLQVLDHATSFGASLSQDAISSICGSQNRLLTSIFSLSS